MSCSGTACDMGRLDLSCNVDGLVSMRSIMIITSIIITTYILSLGSYNHAKKITEIRLLLLDMFHLSGIICLNGLF